MIDRLLLKWQKPGGCDAYVILTGHDHKNGMQLAATELTSIFGTLGYNMKDIIWGEGVWKKGGD